MDSGKWYEDAEEERNLFNSKGVEHSVAPAGFVFPPRSPSVVVVVVVVVAVRPEFFLNDIFFSVVFSKRREERRWEDPFSAVFLNFVCCFVICAPPPFIFFCFSLLVFLWGPRFQVFAFEDK
jgi:hypothetical protein